MHGTTGYGEEGAAASLDEAADYWISQKSALVGQESYVVINIGNEPIGNTDAGIVDYLDRFETNGWPLVIGAWTFAGGQAVSQAWNATVTSNGSTVTGRGVSYNSKLAAGAGTTFGFLGSWNGTNPGPTVSCTAS